MRRSRVVVGAAAAVLPVAAHRGLDTGQPVVLEEVATDALHRCGFASHPHADARVEVGALDCGDERVARRCAGRQVVPLDGRPWIVGKRAPGVGVGDLDALTRQRREVRELRADILEALPVVREHLTADREQAAKE